MWVRYQPDQRRRRHQDHQEHQRHKDDRHQDGAIALANREFRQGVVDVQIESSRYRRRPHVAVEYKRRVNEELLLFTLMKVPGCLARIPRLAAVAFIQGRYPYRHAAVNYTRRPIKPFVFVLHNATNVSSMSTQELLSRLAYEKQRADAAEELIQEKDNIIQEKDNIIQATTRVALQAVHAAIRVLREENLWLVDPPAAIRLLGIVQELRDIAIPVPQVCTCHRRPQHHPGRAGAPEPVHDRCGSPCAVQVQRRGSHGSGHAGRLDPCAWDAVTSKPLRSAVLELYTVLGCRMSVERLCNQIHGPVSPAREPNKNASSP